MGNCDSKTCGKSKVQEPQRWKKENLLPENVATSASTSASSSSHATHDKTIVVHETLRRPTLKSSSPNTMIQGDSQRVSGLPAPRKSQALRNSNKQVQVQVQYTEEAEGDSVKNRVHDNPKVRDMQNLRQRPIIAAGDRDFKMAVMNANAKIKRNSQEVPQVRRVLKGSDGEESNDSPRKVFRIPPSEAFGSGRHTASHSEPQIDLENPEITFECFVFL